MICVFPIYLSPKEVISPLGMRTRPSKFYMYDLAHNTTRRDHYCFSNTVIGWSFRACLGTEEHKQWCDYRRIFLASRFARALVYRADPANPPVLQARVIFVL